MLVHALLLRSTSPHVRLHLDISAGALQQFTRGCGSPGGLLQLHSATEQQQPAGAAGTLGAAGSLVCISGKQTHVAAEHADPALALPSICHSVATSQASLAAHVASKGS
jgi:hypothetical protein